MMVEIVDKNAFKIIKMSNNLVLLCRYQIIVLFSVLSIQFMKYAFSAEIWFMKTSIRILKFKSRVVKSNPSSPTR